MDIFYEIYKNLKEKKHESLYEVIDLDNIKESHEKDIKKIYLKNDFLPIYGLNESHDWQCFQFKFPSGLYIIRNILSKKLQKSLVQTFLDELESPSLVCNLSSHLDKQTITRLLDKFLETKEANDIKKLRWVTLGYHHNWDTKVYSEKNISSLPPLLSQLSSSLGSVMGFPNFLAEACIINIYHKNSSMAPHVDKSEYNLTHPLISISLGCSSLFMVGGTDKNIEPRAIKLHSGDVVVMTGESRVSYHAVPLIFSEINKFESEYQEKFPFMKNSRLNINIRQVN